jgi:YD repeat-containing protein
MLLNRFGASALSSACARRVSARNASRVLLGIAGMAVAVGAFAQASESYTYDSLGRLRQVDLGTGRTLIYTYDAAGNRKVVEGAGPQVSLTSCTSTTPTLSPTAATMRCTVTNVGKARAPSIAYGTGANTTVSGPTAACAAGAVCGTATVTSGTAVGPYAGTLVATPAGGGAVSQLYSLQVTTPSTGGGGPAAITIKNTGAGTIGNVVMSLAYIGTGGCSGGTTNFGNLAPGQSITYNYYRATGGSVSCGPRATGTNATNSPTIW